MAESAIFDKPGSDIIVFDLTSSQWGGVFASLRTRIHGSSEWKPDQ